MPRTSDARNRMIHAAVPLLQRCGVLGTAFSDVLAKSGAPRGSVYHHFPGGKAQLAEEATSHAGRAISAGLAATLADDPLAAIDRIVDLWREIARASDYDAGCAVAAGALDPDPDSGARPAAAAAFADWQRQIAAALVAHGVDDESAAAFAATAVAAIEGAVILARAERSDRPLRQVAATLRQVAAAQLDGAR
ncbi:TetR/AcrR family transcriptional regulator [Patulibacter defluvii]|uniref:TetR/AcrR family transcriptional regulator n=1 Tax=Patulibacter defluvii TaxID=3095358 RepID=UPI002A758E81|nr:TetR/AcrR family transcriptional regulator [Patulibacter sp. DM4]